LYQALLADARFHELLLAFDHDMADAARSEGCQCGGVLHSGRFRRKPRGVPAGLGEDYHWRLSLCCAVHGCRRRKTPASLRFLGRKVYLGAVVVLVSTMLHGATVGRMEQLSELLGVSRRTVTRWREWWRKAFTESLFWRAARAAFMPQVDQERLPASLLECFAGGVTEQLIALLRFLGPITGGAAVHAA
jgi:Homeodomain-like domain